MPPLTVTTASTFKLISELKSTVNTLASSRVNVATPVLEFKLPLVSLAKFVSSK